MFKGKLNIHADRRGASLAGTPVGRLHDARPAPGNHTESLFAEETGNLPRLFVIGAPRGLPGRPEYAHGVSDL